MDGITILGYKNNNLPNFSYENAVDFVLTE